MLHEICRKKFQSFQNTHHYLRIHITEVVFKIISKNVISILKKNFFTVQVNMPWVNSNSYFSLCILSKKLHFRKMSHIVMPNLHIYSNMFILSNQHCQCITTKSTTKFNGLSSNTRYRRLVKRFQGDLVAIIFLNVRIANANMLILEPDVPLFLT